MQKNDACGKYIFQLIPQIDKKEKRSAIEQILKGESPEMLFESDGLDIEISAIRNEGADQTWLLLIVKETRDDE